MRALTLAGSAALWAGAALLLGPLAAVALAGALGLAALAPSLGADYRWASQLVAEGGRIARGEAMKWIAQFGSPGRGRSSVAALGPSRALRRRGVKVFLLDPKGELPTDTVRKRR